MYIDQTLLTTIMPPVTCDDQKVHFEAYLTLSWPWPLTFWPQKLTCSSLPQSRSLVKVWSNSISKYPRYHGHCVC